MSQLTRAQDTPVYIILKCTHFKSFQMQISKIHFFLEKIKNNSMP